MSDGVDPTRQETPGPNLDQDYTGKINGKEVTLPLKEWIARAQKAEAAEEKFRVAAEKEKTMETALKVYDNMKRWLESEDPDAYLAMTEAMGVEDDVAQGVLDQWTNKTEEPEEKTTVADPTNPANPSQQTPQGDDLIRELVRIMRGMKDELDVLKEKQGKVGSLDPQAQRLLREQEAARRDKIVQAAIDKDPVLAYNMKNQSPEGREALLSLIREKIEGRLKGPDADFGDGASILKDVLPEARQLLEKLGTSTIPTPPDGLGPSPGSGGSGVYPPKEPEHVRSDQGDAFESHITELLQYNMNRSATASQ